MDHLFGSYSNKNIFKIKKKMEKIIMIWPPLFRYMMPGVKRFLIGWSPFSLSESN